MNECQKLEQAIGAMTAKPTNEALFAVLQQLQQMMEQGVCLMVPADRAPGAEGQEDRVQFRLLQAADGTGLLPAFTSQEQLQQGAATQAVELELETLLQTALSNEQVSGIVINPWSQPFRLNRQLMQMMQEVEESSDGQLCTADHVPPEFIANLREAAALLTEIESIAIAGLLREEEGSFLLLVQCAPEADAEKLFGRLSAHLKPTVLPVDVAPAPDPLPECANVVYRKL